MGVIMIGRYCRKYRMSKGATLRGICYENEVKTLSAFEHGRSSNIEHLKKYFELSVTLNDVDNFMNGLKEVLYYGEE